MLIALNFLVSKTKHAVPSTFRVTTLAQVTSREGTRLQRKSGHGLTAITLRQFAEGLQITAFLVDTVSLHQ